MKINIRNINKNQTELKTLQGEIKTSRTVVTGTICRNRVMSHFFTANQCSSWCIMLLLEQETESPQLSCHFPQSWSQHLVNVRDELALPGHVDLLIVGPHFALDGEQQDLEISLFCKSAIHTDTHTHTMYYHCLSNHQQPHPQSNNPVSVLFLGFCSALPCPSSHSWPPNSPSPSCWQVGSHLGGFSTVR